MENNNKQQGGANSEALNVLQAAALKQAQFTAAIRDAGGYETFTTFYADLTISERYGPDAVRETYQRITNEWRGDYKYYTEFVLCLNWKIWEHHRKNETLARLYDSLWREADEWAGDNLTGEAAAYYFNVTD